MLEVMAARANEAEAYLRGAAHDATYSRLHMTTRFCQADREWLVVLAALLTSIGSRSWIYREGKERSVWVLETSWRPSAEGLQPGDSAAYVRGYFDAEGGIPRSPDARFYIQFVQKDHDDLEDARGRLVGLGITCGRLHNPSARVDANYWRFYVASRSFDEFIRLVGSWHPRKRRRLDLERHPFARHARNLVAYNRDRL